MFYHIFDYLSNTLGIEGLTQFTNITIRGILAIIFSLLIAVIFGSKVIDLLRRRQIGETVRDLGLAGQMEKKNTPTMGGVIIVLSFVVPVLLFANLGSAYIQIMLIATMCLFVIGFTDDYIKVFRKNKDGLSGRYKLLGQTIIGLAVGLSLYASEEIVLRERSEVTDEKGQIEVVTKDIKTTLTTMPFMEDNSINYKSFIPVEGRNQDRGGWILYVIVATFVIAAVSNGANLTDGLDGLCVGTSTIAAVVLLIFAYLSGNAIYSEYLDIMFIPGSGEMVIFGMAFVGALIGFLWYNGYPAQIFMGDTGSLTIGGVIAVFALLIRKELMLPLICFIFLVESISVMLQVWYIKYTRKKYGVVKRIFLMAPIHHHYQKKGFHEMKIVVRFCIVQLIVAALAVVILKSL